MAIRLIQFDECELDCECYRLCRAGQELKLEKMPMDLLILLATRNGQLVTRDEIVECLWGTGVFVDSEHGINTAIRKIRRALRDDHEQPRFVETVHGKGYRFIATATQVSEPLLTDPRPSPIPQAATTVVVPAPDAALRHLPEPMRLPGRARWIWALTASIVVIFAIGTISLGWFRSSLNPPAPRSIQSLAVIPLENLSGDTSQDYFADGMTDELITMLAKNSTLRVTSRTSVMQYKGTHRPLPEIAKALGVDLVLEGSVIRSTDHVHMNVQLIQAFSDTHLWADSYDRELKDVASLTREAALSVARQLNSTVKLPTAQHYVSPEAHDAYLKGRSYWFAENTEKDVEYLRKATELQPDYALAWSGLSAAYQRSAIHGTGRPTELEPMADAAARRALELDASLPDAHNSMAAVYLFGRFDPEAALKESNRTLELDPGYGEAWFLRTLIFEAMNRMNDALDSQKKSDELDPVGRPSVMTQVLIRMHRYEAALTEAKFRLESMPNDSSLHWELVEIYQYKGMEQEAARETEEATRIDDGPTAAAAVRRAFQRGGYQAILRAQLDSLVDQASRQYVGSANFAWAYANLKSRDQTLHFLEEACRERAPSLVWLQTWPAFDFLHSDPQYRSIVRRIGLQPAW